MVFLKEGGWLSKEFLGATRGGALVVMTLFLRKKMDLTRAALIGTILVVSYYLLLQFGNTEKIGDTNETKTTISPKSENLKDSERLLTDLPVAPEPVPIESLSEPPSGEVFRPGFTIENDVVRLVLEKESGAFSLATLLGVFTELNGSDLVKIFGYKGSGTYFANSGFYNSDGFINPNFYDYKVIEPEGGGVQFVLLGETDEYYIEKTISSTQNKYYFEVEDSISAKTQTSDGVSAYSRITRVGGYIPSGRFNYSHQGPVFSTEKEKFQKFDFGDLADELFLEESSAGWFGLLEPYFMSAWIPDQTKNYTYQGKESLNKVVLTAAGPKTSLGEGFFTNKNTLYVGPRLTNQLKEVQDDLRLVVDYGFLWWIAQPMYLVLEWFHGFFNNWGMAIIFLTLVTKAILWPLTANQYRSMGDMRRIAPQMQALQAKYPNPEDRTKMSQEMMALYKKEGVNPLSSCLPLLLQMPFFIAVYWVLMESVELRHAPFYGWIVDLTARDPYFILAIINGLLMWYTQKLTPTPPSNDPIQANMMKFMPVIFALLFAFFPAGFVLYFTVNTAVTIVQQLWYTSSSSKSS